MNSETVRQPVPRYRIIYNWDGDQNSYSEYPQSVDELMDKLFAPVRNTQIDAMFWCLGGHEAEWKSETMEIVGDSVGRIYDSVSDLRGAEGIRARIDRNENPYEKAVEVGHELGVDVFVSIRMNDNHLQGVKPDQIHAVNMGGLTNMRKGHREWLLGDNAAPEFFASSWNFAIPEVREHRLTHVEEACRLTDWDGIELDWQRHAFHLPENDAYRLRYTLTDLMRAIRQMVDRVGLERGKPMLVAVRVGTTMESCRRIGYDIETWIKEGLCDIVIAAGTIGTDPGVEVEAFRDLIAGTNVRFYAGYDIDYTLAKRLIPDSNWSRAFNRGLAKRYWDGGVDGLYMFNWHATETSRRPFLTTMGDAVSLERTDKVYPALHRYERGKTEFRAGVEMNDRIYGETPVPLYRTITGDGPSFNVPVHDNVTDVANTGTLASIELQIEMEHFAPDDKVSVKWDGRELGTPDVRNTAAADSGNPSDVEENSWLVWSLDPTEADHGIHEVKVVLVKRDPRIRLALVVQHVEVHITYSQ